MASRPTATEVFPDLHLKMSKKIAQLTKVIYMLNTKNEDHQMEVDAMAANHQLEIQEILRDAASKINKFKESIESRQTQVNQEALTEKLQRKYDREKQQAIQEFESYKTKSIERESRITKEYQDRFDSLKLEVDMMNNRFKEKITIFESTTKDLKTSLDENRNASSSTISNLHKKHEKEVEDLVRTNNEKYQSMLLDQLKIQESLRAEMVKSIEQTRNEIRDSLKLEHEKVVGQLRAQLSGDKQESLMLMRRENEEKLQSLKEEYSNKLEKAITDIRIKDEEIQKLQKQFTESQSSSQLQIKSLEDTLMTLRDEIQKLKTQNIESQEEIVRQEHVITDRNTRIHELELNLLKANDDLAKLHHDLLNIKQTGEQSTSSLQSKLFALEKDLTSTRSELAQTKTSLSNSKTEASNLQVQLQKLNEAAMKSAQASLRDKEKLQQQLEEALNAVKDTGNHAQDELNTQRRLMAEREEAFKRELVDRDALHSKDLSRLTDSHRGDLMNLETLRQAQQTQAETREAELLQSLEVCKKEYEGRILALTDEFHKIEDDHIQRHKSEIESLKGTIEQMNKQIQSLSEQADGDKSSLRLQVNKLEQASRTLQTELEMKVKENERVESVCTGLKAQIESLRDELKASQRAFKEKMEALQAQSQAEWTAKMNDIQSSHDKAMAAISTANQHALKSQVDELTQQYELELNALKSLLAKDSSRFSESLAISEEERLKLERLLQDTKDRHLKELLEVNRSHEGVVQELEDRHRRELENTKRELAGLMGQKESDSQSAHQAALAALQEAADKKLREALAKAAAEQEEALHLAERTHRAVLADIQKNLQEDKAKALAALEASHAETLFGIRRDHERASDTLFKDMDNLRKSLEVSEKVIKDHERVIANEREERSKREESFILLRDQLLREYEQDLRKEKERADGVMKEALEKNAAEARASRQEFRDEKSKLEDKIRNLQQDIEKLERKVRDRESRPEDLQRIRLLEEELDEKDALVQKTREEMLYFKREMLNREENYNKKFNVNPTVGVMQVLKPKEADTGHSKKPPRPGHSMGNSSSQPGFSVSPAGGLSLGTGMPDSTMGGRRGSAAAPSNLAVTDNLLRTKSK